MVQDPSGGALGDAVDGFVAALAPVVRDLAARVDGIDADRLEGDVVVEAFNLACACIDADGLHTDDELWALSAAFGHRVASSGYGVVSDLARSRPADLRAAGLLAGRRSWLEAPSTLFDLLVDADRRHGTGHARTYQRHAVQVAHAVAAATGTPRPASWPPSSAGGGCCSTLPAGRRLRPPPRAGAPQGAGAAPVPTTTPRPRPTTCPPPMPWPPSWARPGPWTSCWPSWTG